MAFVPQRLLLLSCYVRTKEPLTSIIVQASDYLLPTNVVSSLRSLWIMPLLCMNFKALAMPFAHPITFLGAAEVVVERPRTLSWFRKMCFIKFSLQSSMTRIGLDSPFSLRSVVPYILTIKGWFSFLKKAQWEIELWNNCLLVVQVSAVCYLHTWYPSKHFTQISVQWLHWEELKTFQLGIHNMKKKKNFVDTEMGFGRHYYLKDI